MHLCGGGPDDHLQRLLNRAKQRLQEGRSWQLLLALAIHTAEKQYANDMVPGRKHQTTNPGSKHWEKEGGGGCHPHEDGVQVDVQHPNPHAQNMAQNFHLPPCQPGGGVGKPSGRFSILRDW